MVEFMYYNNAFHILPRHKDLVLRLTSTNNNTIACHYNKAIPSSVSSLIQKLKRMSANNPKGRAKRIIIVISCTSLIAISVITYLQQIPTISQTIKIYDIGYFSALRLVADVIPQNETLTTTENYWVPVYITVR
jgi:hypothetical protein